MQNLYESNGGDNDGLFDWEVSKSKTIESHPMSEPKRKTTNKYIGLNNTTLSNRDKRSSNSLSSISGSEQDSKRNTYTISNATGEKLRGTLSDTDVKKSTVDADLQGTSRPRTQSKLIASKKKKKRKCTLM
eukprot:TRINITY_DN1719_c0_g1_i3.p1 TRINITY_DN1719_c0_g1~~TRINITY_DN1719_c0_g1_i3.p1  ORF type:complete len:131 (-),score=15.43 TRINITY_DN1719_c0_g1_i3:96-488(-)